MTDAHWLYVVSGEMQYQERGLDEASYPPPATFAAGSMVYTPPMRWHRTYFPVDTVLISMSKRPRDHASHERDVVRSDRSEPREVVQVAVLTGEGYNPGW